MNRRLIAVLLGLGLGFTTQAYSQTAIAPSVKTATTITEADRGAIKQAVTAAANDLANQDPALQSAGRDALIKYASHDSTPSAAYLDAYAQAVNDAMLALAGNPAMRTRMNAAIVVCKVAEKTNSLRLKPAALKFVQDKSEPVILWGVKAHKPLIIAQLRSQITPNDPLITGLPKAIKDNLVAPIVQEAYDALTIDFVAQRATLNDGMYKALVPVVQDLLAARAAQYKSGSPDVPQVDTLATLFLLDVSVWRAQTAEQRVRSAQLTCDLIAATGSHAASLGKMGAGKDDLMQALRLFASATNVLGQAIGKQTVQDLALVVNKLETSADPAVITKACDDLIVAVSAEVQGVKRPVVATRSSN